jgi:aspartyl-tRNA(Asn)/glutamyl-tRNA(Gln) amidotransferase subunit A
VKDNIATQDLETSCASDILSDYHSPFNATVVETLQKKGSLVIGKTNMDQFGMGSLSTNSAFGPVTNIPPFESLSAGGSSGGSAAAVAAGLVEAAMGTDTGGSVRLPAAYTGITGLKPSYGRLSRYGVIPYANSLDTVGLLCKTPETAHKFLTAAQSPDPNDPTCPSPASQKRMTDAIHAHSAAADRWGLRTTKGLRIGVPAEYNIAELTPPIRSAWSRTLSALRAQGHTIVPVSLPSTRHALSAYYVLAAAEASSNLAKFDGVRYGGGPARPDLDDAQGVLYAQTRGRGFGDEVQRRILLGSYTLSSEAIDNYFVQAQRVRRLVQRDFDRVFAMPNPLHPVQQFDLADMDEETQLENKLGPAQVDVLVVPTAPTLPPKLAEVAEMGAVDSYMNDVFTVPASLAGLPAISVPVTVAPEFREEGNVPFAGIQVIGQYWDDFAVTTVGGMVWRADEEWRKSRAVEQAGQQIDSAEEEEEGVKSRRYVPVTEDALGRKTRKASEQAQNKRLKADRKAMAQNHVECPTARIGEVSSRPANGLKIRKYVPATEDELDRKTMEASQEARRRENRRLVAERNNAVTSSHAEHPMAGTEEVSSGRQDGLKIRKYVPATEDELDRKTMELERYNRERDEKQAFARQRRREMLERAKMARKKREEERARQEKSRRGVGWRRRWALRQEELKKAAKDQPNSRRSHFAE